LTVSIPPETRAALFDLDGVLTDSASVHAAAWKQTFDEALPELAAAGVKAAGDAALFDLSTDYHGLVDGRPRLDGVRAFMDSRGISLPEGGPGDGPGFGTLHAIGGHKDANYLKRIARDGVRPFGSTVALIRRLKGQGVATALFSASRNCREVLRVTDLEDLFDEVIDGREAERLGLPGKPDPATLVEAARRVGVEPSDAVVFEDAAAGVRAGRRGRFRLVIGVNRGAGERELIEAGADAVVSDLSEVAAKPAESPWQLVFSSFEPGSETFREALCVTGNGYFATRGAAPEVRADGTHYPGTYAAGVYNRLSTEVEGRPVEHESLVNLPNWLRVDFAIGDGGWFDLGRVELEEYEQSLDLFGGVLSRRFSFRDGAGRKATVEQLRFTSMDDPHLAGLRVSITADDWSGPVAIRSELDGRVANEGVERYGDLPSVHLEGAGTGEAGPGIGSLTVRTGQSGIEVAEASRVRLAVDGADTGEPWEVVAGDGWIGHSATVELGEGQTVTLEKVVALYTSRDRGISRPRLAAEEAVSAAADFGRLLAAHETRWGQLWGRIRLDLDADTRTRMILNLHIFHLLQTVSEHSVEVDAGMPARGLHGEAYRGHVFWDELFAFPFLAMHLPEISRALLLYRYRRLGAAREAAERAGFRGAMFPWESGSSGREEAQVLHLNPRSGRWLDDHSHLQRHVNLAIPHCVWQYWEATGDAEYLARQGAEMMLEAARFWASAATWDEGRGRFEIKGVMGPDEYHDAYPGAGEPGLDNNAYTNVMASWVITKAFRALQALPVRRRVELREQLDLGQAELERWDEVSRLLFVPFHEGVISQFEGYGELEEFDWTGYRERYGDIHRLDRILEAEGDSTNRYKVSKQADALMIFFLLTPDEATGQFAQLGYHLEPETIPASVAYYLDRTVHGSTLSRVTHARVLARYDRSAAWGLFREALESDIGDSQSGTTAEGVHLGAMAGTVVLLQQDMTGIRRRDGVLELDPALPPEVGELGVTFRHRQHWGVRVRIRDGKLRVTVPPSRAEPIKIDFRGRLLELAAGGEIELDLEDRE
jgi:HAD superfamily hydrolase (TIGR01509 family)